MLEDLRKEKGLSQTDLASLLDIPNSTYHMYESGKRKIPVKIAKRIANFFEVEVEDIFLPSYFTVSKTKKSA